MTSKTHLRPKTRTPSVSPTAVRNHPGLNVRGFLHSCFPVRGQVFSDRLSTRLVTFSLWAVHRGNEPRFFSPPEVFQLFYLWESTDEQCCAAGSRGGVRTASREQTPWPAPSVHSVGSWVDLRLVASQSEHTVSHEAHRTRIRTTIPNMLTFQNVRIP